MDIYRAGTRPSQTANPDWFVGDVRIDPVIASPDPSRVNALIVTFAPGARTNWHTHPLGQTIHVLSGLCLAQKEGGPIQELTPGDTAYFGPGERHWHGASPDVGMAHLAIQEVLDGRAADWGEAVTEADYSAPRG